jgi:iron transport multicopper oxidase
MAISLSNFPILLLLPLLSWITEAAIVTYDMNITWVRANPDGMFERPVMGVNGQWPLPIMRATVGDTVIVNVDNQLGNESTTLHFHGLFMNGSTHMDGPMGATQCEIVPGTKLKYNFTVRSIYLICQAAFTDASKIDQPGTYWYHSHSRGQYPDGLRAPLIVDDPKSPYKGKYDHEYVLSVSDWYHDSMKVLIPKFMYRTNPTGAEPVPKAALMNDTQNLTVSIEPGKTYLFRMVNMGAFAGQYIWFENHTLSIIEVDGIYTEQEPASMIYLAAAQRCSFLITAKNETSANYAFVGSMDTVRTTVLSNVTYLQNPRHFLTDCHRLLILTSLAGWSMTARKRCQSRLCSIALNLMTTSCSSLMIENRFSQNQISQLSSPSV